MAAAKKVVAKNVPAKKVAAKKPAAKTVKPAAKKGVNEQLTETLAAQLPVIAPVPEKKSTKAADKPAEDKPAVTKEKKVSKMDAAREVFKANKGKARKDIIELFISQVGLTKAGSATYYSILKNE